MRISHRYRFVFFANPKTGSSTVRQFLDPYSDVRPARNIRSCTPENPFHPHMRPEETRNLFRRFGWDFDGYSKFVFVRNPWARLVSLYEHIHRGATKTIRFHDWVYTVRPSPIGDTEERLEPWRVYGAFSIESFIKGSDGGVLVDKVLRLEDIDRTFVPFLSALGLPLHHTTPIPHRNPGEQRPTYVEYYTAETIEYVREAYRYDIVNYDYRFGD